MFTPPTGIGIGARDSSSISSSSSSSGNSSGSSRHSVDLDRFRRRPELMLWRQRANDQLQHAADLAPPPANILHLRTNAIHLFILLLVSCPDLVDVQVVALAVQYLDRYVRTCVGPAAASPPAFVFYHAAAACIALALKWERSDAAYDLVGLPKDAPSDYNRLIEVFQTSKATKLTPRLLGKIQVDVCARLHHDLWICTPAEWMIMVRNAGPAAFVETPLAYSTDLLNRDPYPSPCWLRRHCTPPGSDPYPTRDETAAALARLPLEEQLLLHALREPALADWTPCRIATACMALAAQRASGRCRAESQLDLTLPELEAARVCTMPHRSDEWTDDQIQRSVRIHRSTSRDAALLLRMLVAAPGAVAASHVPPTPQWLTAKFPAVDAAWFLDDSDGGGGGEKKKRRMVVVTPPTLPSKV